MVRGDRDTIAVDSVNLDVYEGEILGLAGVSGNGQRELAEAIAGLRPVEAGSIRIDQTDVCGSSVRERRELGLGYVPEERMRDGAIGEFTVRENLLLVDHDKEAFTSRGLLAAAAIKAHSTEMVQKFAVKTPTIETTVSSLSGGNIQKVLMARELSAEPIVLLACQPTRGVDIGSAEYIHRRLIEQRERRAATLLVSEDLDELLGLADRLAVMFEGRVVAIVDRADADREQIGLLMAGVVNA